MKEVLIILSVSSFYLATSAQDLSLIHREIAVTDVKVDCWAATLNDDKSFYEKTFEDFTKNEFGTKSKDNGQNEELLEKVKDCHTRVWICMKTTANMYLPYKIDGKKD